MKIFIWIRIAILIVLAAALCIFAAYIFRPKEIDKTTAKLVFDSTLQNEEIKY